MNLSQLKLDDAMNVLNSGEINNYYKVNALFNIKWGYNRLWTCKIAYHHIRNSCT